MIHCLSAARVQLYRQWGINCTLSVLDIPLSDARQLPQQHAAPTTVVANTAGSGVGIIA